VAAALEAIRTACRSTPVGVSTGAWIVPDADQRRALIGAWEVLPDFAGVNFHEPGALEVARLLLSKGIAVEFWTINPPHQQPRKIILSGEQATAIVASDAPINSEAEILPTS
jgi:uncharacterized protein (DUF849 family)